MDEPKAVARNECVDACKEYLHVSGREPAGPDPW